MLGTGLVAVLDLGATVACMNQDIFEKAGSELGEVVEEIGKVIVGQEVLVNRLLTALLSEGHLLLEGVPGLAKTKTVKTVAKVLGGTWQRIQFTPDLVPADLVGTRVYNPGSGSFDVEVGPLMANFVLADEVNRAPAKVQSALLEAMEERQITIARESRQLPRPFVVLATQNPVEQEGTYPLPEAQMDRFMMRVTVGHPSPNEEIEIVRRALIGDEQVRRVLTIQRLSELQSLAKEVFVPKDVAAFAVRLVHLTRSPGTAVDEGVIMLGASPRASIALVRAAQAQALLDGRRVAQVDDVKAIAVEVVAHRLVLSFGALSDMADSNTIVEKLVAAASGQRALGD